MRNGTDKYLGLKRLLAFLAAMGLWGVSLYFSYKGFEFESTTILWFGIVLALVVTVVELVFNTQIQKLNPTLLVTGIICYAYGIYTNITGFYILQHGSLEGFFSGANWLIPIFGGLISEVLPEALFAWSVGAFNDGDLVGNVLKIASGDTDLTRNSTSLSNNSQRPSSSFQPKQSSGNRPSSEEDAFRQMIKNKMDVKDHTR